MTGADFAGQIIDRLLERRRGAPGSRKWWQRLHVAAHNRMVMLACPFCPDAAELRRMIYSGPVIASANDIKAALRADPEGPSE